jgi:sugar lactone lactonase YvrE
MLFLAAGLPARAQDMTLAQVLLPGEGWHEVKGDWSAPASLAGDGDGNVYLADAESKKIFRIGKDGKTALFATAGAVTVGLAIDPMGRLVGCQPAVQKLVAFDDSGREQVLAEKFEGRDVAFHSRGTYATVPDKGSIQRRWTVGVVEPLAGGLATPRGLVFWADGGTLVVGEAGSKYLVAFRVEKDGSLTARERYYPLLERGKEASEVGGLVLDTTGRLYAATREGVQMFDPTGRLSGVMSKPERQPITALAFGGAEHDQLYVVCGKTVYMRKLKVKGLLPFRS